MYPNFRSLSHREEKRLELLRQAERDLKNDAVKRRAYKEAMWAADNEKNRINLNKTSTSTQTSTDANTPSQPANNSSNNSPPRDGGIGGIDADFDIGDPDDTLSDFDDREASPIDRRLTILDESEPMDEEEIDDLIERRESEQLNSFNFLRALFGERPELATFGFHPIRDDGSGHHPTVILGPNAELRNERSGRKSTVDHDRIDWVLTEKNILDRLGSISRMDIMRDQRGKRVVLDRLRENKTEKRNEQQAERERMLVEDMDALYINRNKRKEASTPLEDMMDDDESNVDAQEKILGLYRANREAFDRMEVNPINHSQEMMSQYKVVLSRDGTQLLVVKNGQDANKNPRHLSTVARNVSWVYTLQYLSVRMQSIGSLSPSLPEDRVDNVGKQQLVEWLFATLPWLDQLRISPFQKHHQGSKIITTHYLGQKGDLYTMKTDKRVTELMQSRLKSSIDWGMTLSHAADAIRRYNDQLEDILRNTDETSVVYNSMLARRETIKDVLARVDLSRRGASLGMKSRGRGLRGRGPINLRDVEGTGTASDLKYKRLGSKFIRLADLKSNRLKLVYPNRTGVGPIRSISPELSELINKLVFEKDIDQQLYGKLSVADKQLFREVLKATHLQHQFTNAPGDPLKSLKAEFDKLRGQVMIGNDNPDLIRELKTMAVDLYGQKMISEADFRSLIVL